MAFFIGLCVFYLLGLLLSLLLPGTYYDTPAELAALAAALMYLLVGAAHFAKPDKLERMLEGLTRYKKAANYISGLAEIVLAVGLLIPAARAWAAAGLVLLMLVVFPANIHVARRRPTAYNISRLFFQPLYILWLLWAGQWLFG